MNTPPAISLASISLFVPLVGQTSYIDRLTELGAPRIAIIVAAVVLVLWLGYMGAEARNVKVERTDLESASLPAEFDGTKVLFVADIHAGPRRACPAPVARSQSGTWPCCNAGPKRYRYSDYCPRTDLMPRSETPGSIGFHGTVVTR